MRRWRLPCWYSGAMPEPWNPDEPPTSLSESDERLEAETSKREARDEWKFVGLYVLVILGVIWLLYSFGPVVLDFLGRLFR
jgi:hypothetical protein